MKRLLLIMISVILLCGCDFMENEAISDSMESDIKSENTSTEESIPSPEELFDFLSSKYYVSAEQETLGRVHKYVYYFVDGRVEGTKIITIFTSTEMAESYANALREDKTPYVQLDGKRVIAYYDSKFNAYYAGYTLEKMKFVLEHMGYKYEIHFDEEEFYNEFSEASKKN